jgi:hypothetical protein
VILVTGATGNAGKAVVRALLDHGEQVRGLVRDGAVSLPEGAARAVVDLNRPDTLAAHLDGVDAVFLLSGYDGLEQTPADMRSAGVGACRSAFVECGAGRGPVERGRPLPHPLRAGGARVGPALDVPPAEQFHVEHAAVAAAASRRRCRPASLRRRCGGFDRPGRPRGRRRRADRVWPSGSRLPAERAAPSRPAPHREPTSTVTESSSKAGRRRRDRRRTESNRLRRTFRSGKRPPSDRSLAADAAV